MKARAPPKLRKPFPHLNALHKETLPYEILPLFVERPNPLRLR